MLPVNTVCFFFSPSLDAAVWAGWLAEFFARGLSRRPRLRHDCTDTHRERLRFCFHARDFIRLPCLDVSGRQRQHRLSSRLLKLTFITLLLLNQALACFYALLCVVRFYCKAPRNPVLRGATEIKVIVIIIIVTSFPPTDYTVVYTLSPLMNRCVMTDPVETSELSPVAFTCRPIYQAAA